MVLGEHGARRRDGSAWTAETARSEAERLRGVVASGGDPATERDIEKSKPTVKDFAQRYLKEYAELHKAASSVDADRRMLERVIVKALGHRRIDKVTRADVQALHYARRSTPVDANRSIALLSKIMNMAEGLGLRSGPNPCRGVARYREKRHERFLSGAELGRLGASLAAAGQKTGKGAESPFALAALRLLALTGARLGEILGAGWSDSTRARAR